MRHMGSRSLPRDGTWAPCIVELLVTGPSWKTPLLLLTGLCLALEVGLRTPSIFLVIPLPSASASEIFQSLEPCAQRTQCRLVLPEPSQAGAFSYAGAGPYCLIRVSFFGVPGGLRTSNGI